MKKSPHGHRNPPRSGFDIARIEQRAVERFGMPIQGIHGISHWRRVHENGVYLAKHAGADLRVVEAFAFIHDSCRESDGADSGHGLRAAEFAHSLRDVLGLSGKAFDLLFHACEFHEKGRVTDDPTIGACWDSDRLDLGRVGCRPDPKLLSTEAARRPTVIDWGYKRSRGHKARLKS